MRNEIATGVEGGIEEGDTERKQCLDRIRYACTCVVWIFLHGLVLHGQVGMDRFGMDRCCMDWRYMVCTLFPYIFIIAFEFLPLYHWI